MSAAETPTGSGTQVPVVQAVSGNPTPEELTLVPVVQVVSGNPTPEELAPVPVVQVVSGNPTPEELAAVIAVLTAVSGGDDGVSAGADARSRSGWTDRAHAVRPAVRPGPGGWRASAFPPSR